MKKIIMLGVMISSFMAFSMNVFATDVSDIDDMSSVITGSTVEGDTLTLNQSVDLTNNYFNITSGTYIIDLNGFTLSGNNNIVFIIEGESVSLTIIDNSLEKDGAIICTKEDDDDDDDSEYQAAILLKSGALTINEGTFKGENYGIFSISSIIINDGTFLGDVGLYTDTDSTTTINNGVFGNDESDTGARLEGNVTIKDGLFNGQVGLDYAGKTTEDVLLIKDGIFGNGNSSRGIFLQGGKVTIDGAVVNGGDDGFGLHGFTSIGYTIDLTINNIDINAEYIGVSLNSLVENENNSVKIKGGTYSGKEIGFIVGEELIGYTKISGGIFNATGTNEDDVYGGIMIILKQSMEGDIISDPGYRDFSYESEYTLNSLLESGYNYSNRIFNEKTETQTSSNSSLSILSSSTAKDVFVAAEKTITIKNGIVNGTVTVQEKAVVGEKVKITVTPAKGYKLKSINALDRFDEEAVEIANNEFTMPSYNVFIGAEFEVDYSYIENSEEQTYVINKDDKLVFELNPNYNLFEEGGKVYVDDELVDEDNYTSQSGSTIITLSKTYLDKLSLGNHTLKVTFNTDVSVETTFVVKKEELNPKTGDSIMLYVILGSLSLLSLLGTGLYIKKSNA